jgi:Uma2 family endonuclease
MASLPDLEPRPFSVAEYHRMIDAGILGEDERVELLEGVIVAVSPQKRRHAYVIQELMRILARLPEDKYRLLAQLPLTLGESSEPEPDLAVVTADAGSSRTEHPRTALLVVEVAGESLRKDRLIKARIYARAGIPEYWLFNLDEACLEALRDPDPEQGAYRTRAVFRREEEVRSSAVPELAVRPADLLD